MAFIATRLDQRIEAGFRGGPQWSNEVIELDNGREVRNGNWLYPKNRYSANLVAFRAQDRQALLGAYYATAGRLHAFLFQDPTENEVTDEPLAPLTGTSTPLQIVRTYAMGAMSRTRLVQAIDTNNFVLKRNGSPYANYTIDAETGIATPTSTWASGTYTWTGRYFMWVRFDSDWAAFEAVADGVWQTDVELIEVRR